MRRRVRGRHRAPGLISYIVFVACLLLYCTAVAFFRVGAQFLATGRYGWIVLPAVVGAILLVAVVRRRLRLRRLARARQEIGTWARTSGWTRQTFARTWPWTTLIRSADMVTVSSAYVREIAGLHVTVGELSWIDNGLGNAVASWNGHGVFSIVRLPAEHPGAAVRLRRPAHRPRADGDEFRQRFRPLTDTPAAVSLLANPTLQEAHVRGEIAPWTLLADELFTVEPTVAPVTPATLESAAHRALHTVELLNLPRPAPTRAPLSLPDKEPPRNPPPPPDKEPAHDAPPPPDKEPARDAPPPPGEEPDLGLAPPADEGPERGAVTHPGNGSAPAR